jgi:transposase-like protein
MADTRRRYSAQEKVLILKRHLVDGVPVSDLCDEIGLHPNVFYRWQREFFENGVRAFEQDGSKSQTGRLERRVHELQDKLARKDEVISELLEEHVALKKKHGAT